MRWRFAVAAGLSIVLLPAPARAAPEIRVQVAGTSAGARVEVLRVEGDGLAPARRVTLRRGRGRLSVRAGEHLMP